MKTFSTIAVIPVAVAMLVGCHRSEPVDRGPQDSAAELRSAAASAVQPEGIHWFEGGVEAAFTEAQAENRPVLLYWGAVWCPACSELKATVFTQREFIEKTRLFVPVYLDGDDPGAQKWSETFNVSGYPTVLVLRPDRTEAMRLAGGQNLNRYLGVLDVALDDVRPIEEVIASLHDGTAPLSLDDCKRLAYSSSLIEQPARRAKLAGDLQRAVDRCPPDARVERARLTVMRATGIANEEAMGVIKGGQAASPRLKEAVRDLLGILQDRELVRAVADIALLDQSSIDMAPRMGVVDEAEANRLRQRWIAALEAEADDPNVPMADRLRAFLHKLTRLKGQAPKGSIPAALADEAHSRVQAALAGTYSAPERVGVVGAALSILDPLGDTDRAKAIVGKEIETAAAPYYYMRKMAQIEEGLDNEAAAVAWFERAYRQAQGPATRFEWGLDYVNALLRLKPQDETAVRDAAVEILGELEGPKRIYGNTRDRIEVLDTALREWSSAGRHDQTIAAIRGRMAGICEKIPPAEPQAREACAGFLKTARLMRVRC